MNELLDKSSYEGAGPGLKREIIGMIAIKTHFLKIIHNFFLGYKFVSIFSPNYLY